MILKVSKSITGGRVRIPGSKSHTIRALFIASLAKGKSVIADPLVSNDALSAVDVCRALGADISTEPNKYIVDGFGGIPQIPSDVVDVGNSGTTLRFGVMTSALTDGYTVFTGDHQIRKRPVGPLIEAINNLGGSSLLNKEQRHGSGSYKRQSDRWKNAPGFSYVPVSFVFIGKLPAS